MKISGLYLILDTEHAKGRTRLEVAGAGTAGGARVIQLREKTLSARDAYPVALKIRGLTDSAGVVFIVNDSVELAMAAGADGVHLGQDDLPVSAARSLLGHDKIIGVSTHSLDEALKAVEDGADYIGFGPIFATDTKDAGPAQGTEGLRLIREKVRIPVVAIGGIDASNAAEVIRSGADAVAVITAVTGAADMADAVRAMAEAYEKTQRRK